MERQLDPTHAEVRKQFNETLAGRIAARMIFWATHKLDEKEPMEVEEENDPN